MYLQRVLEIPDTNRERKRAFIVDDFGDAPSHRRLAHREQSRILAAGHDARPAQESAETNGNEKLAQVIQTAVRMPTRLLLEQLNMAEQKLLSVEKELGPEHVEVLKAQAPWRTCTKVTDRVDGIMLGLEARVPA